MAKIAALVVFSAILLAVIGSFEARTSGAPDCALAVAQETARLLADRHSPDEAQRISPLEVSASRPECR